MVRLAIVNLENWFRVYFITALVIPCINNITTFINNDYPIWCIITFILNVILVASNSIIHFITFYTNKNFPRVTNRLWSDMFCISGTNHRARPLEETGWACSLGSLYVEKWPTKREQQNIWSSNVDVLIRKGLDHWQKNR